MSKLSTQTPSVMHQVDGILAVHEFHIWQLAGDRIIASAHVSWESSTLVSAHLGKTPKFNRQYPIFLFLWCVSKILEFCRCAVWTWRSTWQWLRESRSSSTTKESTPQLFKWALMTVAKLSITDSNLNSLTFSLSLSRQRSPQGAFPLLKIVCWPAPSQRPRIR